MVSVRGGRVHRVLHWVGRTWLATTCFAIVITCIWWRWLGWETAASRIAPTLMLTPILWWWIVGRTSSRSLRRGIVTGAVIGPVTQVGFNVATMAWQALLHSGRPQVAQDPAAGAQTVLYMALGLGAVVVGSVLGLGVQLLQRAIDGLAGNLRQPEGGSDDAA